MGRYHLSYGNGGLSNRCCQGPEKAYRRLCVANLPTSLDGLRMVIYIAELANAGTTPDGGCRRRAALYAGRDEAQPALRAVNHHPGRIAHLFSRGRWHTAEIRACSVTFSPHPEQIDAAHPHYHQGQEALG